MRSSEQVDLLVGDSRWASSSTTWDGGETAVGQRAELAAQPQDVAVDGAPRQPRLPVARRRLEEDDRWDLGRRQPGEQRSAGQAHGVSASLVRRAGPDRDRRDHGARDDPGHSS